MSSIKLRQQFVLFMILIIMQVKIRHVFFFKCSARGLKSVIQQRLPNGKSAPVLTDSMQLTLTCIHFDTDLVTST